MKKLFLLTVVVAVALIGFITILCFLPCNGQCCHEKNKCEMTDENGKCSGDKNACEGKEHRTEKVWTDADGKMHREIIVTMGDGGGVSGGKMNGCPMDKGKCGMGMENGKCEMDKGMDRSGKCGMEMHGCCCCCMMMMNGMMGNHGMDSMQKSDSSVHVKVRGKL
jgi:hypothetical protein